VGGKPAAAHRPADQRDDTAVLQFDRLRFSSTFERLAQAIGDVAVRVAVEVVSGEPMHQQLAQRRSGPRMLRSQIVHVDVDLIAQHQTRGAVEHAQPLRHVVERRAKQSRLLSPLAVDEQSGNGRRAQAKRQADHRRSHWRRCLRQGGDQP